MNKRYFDISLWMLLGLVASIVACVDPAEEERKEEEQRVADSVAQAESDNDALNDYIENRIATKADLVWEDVVTDDFNVRYAVIEPGTGREVETNDILSVDYLGRLTDTVGFDTSIRDWAILNDSIAYQEAGLDFTSIYNHYDGNLESALDSAARTGTLDYYLFSSAKTYAPFVYNHIDDGSGVGSFIPGFTLGLQKVVPLLKKGGVGEIYIPSAVAYGTIGSEGGILPNTPLVFEVTLSDLRPDRE